MNDFADTARRRKATDLMVLIDREAAERGLKPWGTTEEIEAVQEMVMAYTDKDWFRLACALPRKTKPKQGPSPETIDLVLHSYQQRAENAASDEDPFARLG